MDVKLYIIAESVDGGRLRCLQEAWEERDDAVAHAVKRFRMSPQEALELSKAGKTSRGKRRFAVCPVGGQVRTPQEDEDDFCSMMYGIDNN